MRTLDLNATNALVGLSVIEVIQVFRETAPSLKECRSAPPGDLNTTQGLLDAEIMAGITAGLLAGAAAILTRGLLPLILSGLALLLITQYYRSVLRSLPTGETE